MPIHTRLAIPIFGPPIRHPSRPISPCLRPRTPSFSPRRPTAPASSYRETDYNSPVPEPITRGQPTPSPSVAQNRRALDLARTPRPRLCWSLSLPGRHLGRSSPRRRPVRLLLLRQGIFRARDSHQPQNLPQRTDCRMHSTLLSLSLSYFLLPLRQMLHFTHRTSIYFI
jgi:hypothetical protein